MAHMYSDEYEKCIASDCNKLFIVGKNLESYSPKKEEETLKYVYKIIRLISSRQNAKPLSTYFAVKYICNHPVLPTVLVEIIRCSQQIKLTTCAIEILLRLIVKNSFVQEAERKTIRKLFWTPVNFKQLVECVQIMYLYFVEENSSALYDMQLKLLKVINCLYMRKGNSQTSLVNACTVQFIGELIDKYKNQRDMFQSFLPLIKVLCRNRKHCDLLTCERFFNSLTSLTPVRTKAATIITIFKLMSKNVEAAQEMSKCEKVFTFVLSMLQAQCDKTIQKKYLMTILYKITRHPAGVQIISKTNFWNMLFDFLSKNERLDELRLRLMLTKGFTILNRGVNKTVLSIVPFKLDLRQDIQRNSEEVEDQTDESDNENEDSDCDDENNNQQHGRLDSSSMSEEDYEECGVVYDEDEEDDEGEDLTLAEDIPSTTGRNKEDVTFMKPYFREFSSAPNDEDDCCKLKIYQGAKEIIISPLNESDPERRRTLQKLIAFRVNRHEMFNNLAFPDAVKADGENLEEVINPSTNYFSIENMSLKVKHSKGLEESEYPRETVYQLTGPDDEKINIPDPDTFKRTDFENVARTEAQCKSGARAYKINPPAPSLRFESRFECGNLRTVERVGDVEYNLFLTPDVNLHSGLQWFYFQVSDMVAGETYEFNIINFQKVNSQFNYGMQPVLFSTIEYVLNGTGWNKAGEKIIYYGNEYTNEEKTKQFRTLSFSVTFPYNNDYCYLAYHYPYSYSRLMVEVHQFTDRNTEEIYSRVDKLCTTVNSNEVPLITITSSLKRSKSLRIPYEKRSLVFITARVHPCESNSSWIMDGILQFLFDEQDERAACAREHYIFKIIPMLNPEGVICGNTRCGITGTDLNRCWKEPHPALHPEIYYAKKLVQYAKQELKNDILTFIDIHGHSRKKFFFFYGCNPKQSWNDNDKVGAESSDTSYYIIPRLLSANENMKTNFCRYNIEKKRESTCRVVMWREFDIKCSYTLECSYCSGENKKKMTIKMLRDIGISIISSLANLAENSQKRQT